MSENKPLTPEKINNDININSDVFFKTVELNVPETMESDDEKLSSLFGDKTFTEVNPFIYDKELLSNKKAGVFSQLLKKRKKTVISPRMKIAIAAAVLFAGSFSIGNAIFKGEKSNYLAGASPIPENSVQNTGDKTQENSDKVASGEFNKEEHSYKIGHGDTIASVSKKLSIEPEVLKLVNNIQNEEDFLKKSSLRVPAEKGIIHKVNSGETIEIIALKYKTDQDKLISANQENLKNPNFLQINQPLFIPGAKEIVKTAEKPVKLASSANNIVHKLAPGETLGSLAQRYGVSLEKIMSVNGNLNPLRLQINQPIIIPVSEISRDNSRSRGTKLASRSLMNDGRGRMLFPTSGNVSSNYGPRGYSFHRGIDVAAPYGTSINAAQAGKVVHAGWSSGYGRTVEIEHSNGLVTRYAHCSRILVSYGQYVDLGQQIAKIGSTGHSTGPHLHFEVLVNGRQVNPRKYL